jgi:hypothetical protein
MPYQAAVNWNNVAGLTTLTIEPAQPLGLSWPEAVTTLEGGVVLQGYPVTELVWNMLLDRADLQTLLAQFGLGTTWAGTPVASRKVTVRLLDNNDQWVNVNAMAVAPNGGRRTMLGWQDVRIRLTHIHAAS